ncbi:hypothetical protein ACFL2Q_09450 [Thermodesulfobacteriota bacterium]
MSIKWLTILILVLTVVAVLLNVKLMVDVGGQMDRLVTAQSQANAKDAGTLSLHGALAGFKGWLFVMLGTVLSVLFGVGMLGHMAFGKMTGPLDELIPAARHISEGSLDISVKYSNEGSAGELARLLNDIASNYQEVLLFTGTKVGRSRQALDRIEKAIELEDESDVVEEIRKEIHLLREELDTVSDMISDFKFFDARFDGTRVVRGDYRETR